MFGSLTRNTEASRRLASEFQNVWPDASTVQVGDWLVGAHSHGAYPAIKRLGTGAITVDGDYEQYRLLAESVASDAVHEAPTEPRSILKALYRKLPSGNVALVDQATDSAHLMESESGAYPLYYAELSDGFLYSSHLRPLARATRADPDWLGIVSFLDNGYIVGDRSFFKGIRRLRPGEAITWSLNKASCLSRRLQSRVWAVEPVRPECNRGLASVLAERLRSTLRSGLPSQGDWGLMMSGGWDSRTLLGVRPDDRRPPLGFSHGDPGSRELDLVRRVCQSAGVAHRQAALDESFLAPSLLERLFARVEVAMFPYWLQSGENLAEIDVDCVASGVYGEVLGGHYGPAMLATGWKKMAGVARGLLGVGVESQSVTAEDLPDVRSALLRGSGERRPTGLAAPIWDELQQPAAALAADVERHLKTLLDRGVPTPERMVEAFVTEHRGAQYIHGQLRSARAAVDVATPFAQRQLLERAGSVPLSAKIHNRLNRRMLRQGSPELLRLPLAATLVPASRPLWWQEASRLGRKVYEDGHWWLHRHAEPVVGPPRLAWINFEGLRGSEALKELGEALDSNLWERSEVDELLRRADEGDWKGSMHPIVHKLLTMYTVDRMLE